MIAHIQEEPASSAPIERLLSVAAGRDRLVPWAVAIAAALAALWLLNSPPIVLLIPALLLGAALLLWAALFSSRHRDWSILALVLLEVILSTNLLPLEQDTRPIARYPLMALFSLSAIPVVWRSGLLRQGGFRLYLFYFLWTLLSVSYSPVPLFSVGRAAGALLFFFALCAIALEVKGREDIDLLMERFLLGCGIITLLLPISLFVLPQDVAFLLPGPMDNGIVRFRGIFDSPNQIGELMLATVGVGLAHWGAAHGWKKAALALLMIATIVAAALADSRSPFGALAIGGALYLIWKYRLRGALICAAALAMAITVALMSPLVHNYVARGDIATVTGRSEVWRFALARIKESPWLGYGYEVEGQILQSRYFDNWEDLWTWGPRSSLHNGYLSRMIGVGVPAFALWLFLFLRPWVSLFRRTASDAWNLKPIALLTIIPILILNFAESTAGDCRYSMGLFMVLSWAFAERYRLQGVAEKRAQEASRPLPAAFAALARL